MSRRTGFLIAGGVVVLILVVATVSAVAKPNQIAGTASPADRPPGTPAEREALFTGQVRQLVSSQLPDESLVGLGWNSCQNIHMAGTSRTLQADFVARGGAMYLDDAAELVDAALATLCPNGETHR